MAKKHADRMASIVGASRTVGTAFLMVFVPTSDRTGRKLPGAGWTRPVLDILGRLFRGATAYPKGQGVWRDDAAGGRLVHDDTTIAFSYVAPEDLTDEAMLALGAFLKRMGREARQGEVGVVLEGRYIGITDFEEE